jgi:hypothetical protein
MSRYGEIENVVRTTSSVQVMTSRRGRRLRARYVVVAVVVVVGFVVVGRRRSRAFSKLFSLLRSLCPTLRDKR